MKVLQINCTYGEGSTGKITEDLHHFLLDNGFESVVLYSDGKTTEPRTKKYMNKFERNLFSICSHITGNYGFEGSIAAHRIIRIIKKEKPDIVQIHNLHSHNGNLNLLFKYLSKTNVEVCYSLHDCWPFTGYCPHFSSVNCYKWKVECNNCPVYKQFSYFFDKSKSNFIKKKNALSECNRLHLISVSNWIKNIASQSFLKDKDMIVFPPGIDQTIFCQKDNVHFKEAFSNEKINILGVAFNFTESKGLLDFLKLASICGDKFNIILVGNVPNGYKLPNNILHIERQSDQNALAELFSSADIFLNLTKEETFGLTNVEALSCGTPVITYNSGGSPESIDSSCGAVVESGDFDNLVKTIESLGKKKEAITLKCIERSKLFSIESMCKNYLNFYNDIMKGQR